MNLLSNKQIASSYDNVSSRAHMKRTVLLVAVIVLSYMAIVNIFLAQFLYKRYVPSASTPVSSILRQSNHTTVSHHEETRPALSTSMTSALEMHAKLSSVCPQHPRLDIAVVIRHTHMTLNNDPRVQPEIMFLALLKSALSSTAHPYCRVSLVMEARHFVASYRVWCEALAVDTRLRCACELMFTANVATSAVAAHVHHQDVCVHGLFLVEANSTFPNHMLLQPSILQNAKVVCLLQECTGLALFVPERFLRWQATQASQLDSQIVAQATGMHMITQNM